MIPFETLRFQKREAIAGNGLTVSGDGFSSAAPAGAGPSSTKNVCGERESFVGNDTLTNGVIRRRMR